MAYLDNTGVGTLWSRIKTYVSGLGFYTKPSTGIPASDIESGVIPTVPSNVSAFNNDAGYTTNTGTITSVKMNGSTIASSGEADLGTVITSHQDISGKEDTSNKVTSLSSSSTDTQYPSAKAVYDLIGDIETILASI